MMLMFEKFWMISNVGQTEAHINLRASMYKNIAIYQNWSRKGVDFDTVV